MLIYLCEYYFFTTKECFSDKLNTMKSELMDKFISIYNDIEAIAAEIRDKKDER